MEATSEPTVRLEPSNGTTQFSTNAASTADNRQRYLLTPNADQKVLFKKRLISNYPAKFVLFVSMTILLLNFVILYCEFLLNPLRYYQYNVYFVSKYAVITSLTNNLYAILGLITSKFFK